jgi:glucosamine-6-phosphate deaminase
MAGISGTADIAVFDDRQRMGAAAARDIATALRAVLAERGSARMMFAAAPSQSETLDALVREPGIDWSRVTAFHLDEYLGLAPDAPQRFGTWLRHALFDRLPFGAVHLIDPDLGPDAAAERYADLLAAAPLDVVVLGIGVNGHLAFNDPPVARFDDDRIVKVVQLDETCRRQQVEDGCFAALEDVPPTALTVTIPAILGARRLFCVVPGASKAEALRATALDPISTACPSTVLRTHPACAVYADAAAAALLPRVPAA